MSGPKPSLFLRGEALAHGVDLLYFAHRDLLAEIDPVLARHKLGRADHRALHFIARRPGLTVSELQAILKVSKQSLHRIISPLLKRALVRQETGRDDRRARTLHLTVEGAAVVAELNRHLHAYLASAYRDAGPDAVDGFWQVLLNLAGEEERHLLEDALP